MQTESEERPRQDPVSDPVWTSSALASSLASSLTPDQRSVCDAFAVLGVPVPLSVLGEMLSATGARARSGSLLNADRAKRIVEQLEAARALRRDGRDIQLAPGLVRDATDALIANGDFEVRASQLEKVLGAPSDSERSARAHLRAALLRGKRREARRFRALMLSENQEARLREVLELDGRSVQSLEGDAQPWAVGVLLEEAFRDWRRDDDALEAGAALEDWDDVRHGLALHAWVEGRLETALRFAAPRTPELMATRASIQLRAGLEAALDTYDLAHAATLTENGTPRAALEGIHGLLHLAALIAAERSEDAKQVLSAAGASDHPEAMRALRGMVDDEAAPELPALEVVAGWQSFAAALVRIWRGDVWEPTLQQTLELARDRAHQLRWLGLAEECEVALDVVRGTEEKHPGRLATVLVTPASWRSSLAELGALAAAIGPGAGKQTRVVFELRETDDEPGFLLRPRLQQEAAAGGFTRGRAIAAESLAESLDAPDDRRIAAHLTPDGKFEPGVLAALVGHPRVVSRHDPTRPLPVRRGRVTLRIQRGDEGLSVELHPSRPGVEEDGEGFVVTTFDESHVRLASLAARLRDVPNEAEKDLVGTAIGLVGTVDLRSDAALPDEGPADPAPRVRLRRVPSGVAWNVVVSPFGPGGPVGVPGEGEVSWMRIEGNGPRAVRRDLDAEQRQAEALLEACPALARTYDGKTERMEDALDLLGELQRAEVAVDWREARKPLRQAGTLDVDGVRTSLALGAGGWLELTGEVEVDGAQVMAFEQLLEAARSGEGYVTLSDGRLMRLSETLREELTRIEAMRVEGKLHPSLLMTLDRSPLQPELSGNAIAKRERMLHVMRSEPTLPEGLNAELRDYQVTGFQWLHRLGELGFGACLADDMGLGKTIQTLTLLLSRAPLGPALVVAPTSVIGGWAEQAAKFAPSLRVQRLEAGSSPEERRTWVQGARDGDVILTTHGLLPRERELLAERDWATVVLDEAQAFKNPRTARARAAYALEGRARVALSGTPVENRTSELWSLFRFLQPGLLGSQKHFREDLALPIEQERDPFALERLRHRVSPFVLRRTKKEVLVELPPRTDVVLRVEPEESQAALIEAVRQEGLAATGKESNRMQVLAAITKLRQACCHPRLVVEDSKVPSAKMEAFLELAQDLRDGGHRVLVFSQFVRHLALVEEALEGTDLTYQYLDGSTPAKVREERIAAFQAGEGDLFLISLKAGGTGVHLTAADYVVHLDPWWNPAVEDQASDRAHRIGQTRAVTVYRLVVAGSIEEKLLALHERKRELADSLLESAGESTDLETLVGLLK